MIRKIQQAAAVCLPPLLRLLSPPMQRPPAVFSVSSSPLLINSLSLSKSPPSRACPYSSALVSTLESMSASYLCVCTTYVAVDVPLIPVLAIIFIVRPSCNYCHRPYPLLSLVMGSVMCVYFVPEAIERLVMQKNLVGKPSSLGQSMRS